MRDLPDLLAPGDVLVLNDTKVIPSRLHGLRVRDETAARVEIMLHKREGADRWRAFARPAKKLARRRPHPLRRSGREHGLRTGSARCRGRGEGRGRRGCSALRLCRAGARRSHRPARRIAAAALYRRQACRPTTRDLRDYQTVYAREEGAVAAPTAGLHFTDELFRRLDERGIGLPLRDAACRRRHLPAGQGGRYTEPPHACRMGLRSARDGAGLERGAGAGRADRRGRHHIAAPAGKRGARGRHRRAVFRRHGDLHHAGLSLQGRRRADDEFPPAAFDPVHAGLGLRRARPDRAGPPMRHAIEARLSVLFVRRCKPAS